MVVFGDYTVAAVIGKVRNKDMPHAVATQPPGEIGEVERPTKLPPGNESTKTLSSAMSET
jgi:hypothetical protein